MKQLAEGLKKILNHELQLHQQLLAAARSMNAAIKNRQLAGVQAACRAYDECTCCIEAAEEKRLETSDKIGAHFGITGRLNLAGTVALFPAPHNKELAETGAKLRAIINQLHRINIANRILLEESLMVIAKTFEIISEASRQFRGYKNWGTKDASKPGRTIINTVA